uniref:Anaphase-promoting complex subunit 13 n=1 Tax=Romanomermis culicivorax TaxID=13658 RepID=A0A915KXE7_ROMCU
MSYNQNPLLNPGRSIDQIDEQWRRTVRLPVDLVPVPLDRLPDPDSENRNTQETVEDLEKKWSDLALHRIDFEVGRRTNGAAAASANFYNRNDATATAVLSGAGVNRRNNDERNNATTSNNVSGAPVMNGPAATSVDNIT